MTREIFPGSKKCVGLKQIADYVKTGTVSLRHPDSSSLGCQPRTFHDKVKSCLWHKRSRSVSQSPNFGCFSKSRQFGIGMTTTCLNTEQVQTSDTHCFKISFEVFLSFNIESLEILFVFTTVKEDVYFEPDFFSQIEAKKGCKQRFDVQPQKSKVQNRQ